MMIDLRRLVTTLCCWTLVVTGVAAADERLDVTFGGGSAQGSFSAVGEALGEMIRREYPGSAYVYEPGSLAGALVRVARGQLPIGLAGQAEISAALKGQAPYRRAYAADEFSIVARVADGMYAYVLARNDFLARHRIETLADVARDKIPVRVSLGQKGNLSVYNQARTIFGVSGLDEGSIKQSGGEVFYFPARASIDLIKDNRADMMFSAGFHPDARLFELVRATPVAMLPLGQEAIAAVTQEMGVEPAVIPPGLYEFLTLPYDSTSLPIYIVASPQTGDATVYKIVTALYKHFDYLRSLHPSFADYSADNLPRPGPFRLHPAAAAAYRDLGVDF